MKSFALLFVAFVALVCLPRPASAQAQGFEMNVTVVGHTGIVAGSPSDHFLSFSGPIEIPGVGLAPGAYVFRFITHSVMQVLSEDRSTVYAMFFVTRTWRNEVTDQYSVTPRRMWNNAPDRLATMFSRYSSTGYELRYPILPVMEEPTEGLGITGTERLARK